MSDYKKTAAERQAELEKQKEEFLKSGGVIEKIDSSISKKEPPLTESKKRRI